MRPGGRCWRGRSLRCFVLRVRKHGDLCTARHHTHAAIKSDVAGLLRGKGDGSGSKRKELADTGLRSNENAAAARCLLRVDAPLDRNALQDGELIRHIAITDNLHVDDLLAIDDRRGLQPRFVWLRRGRRCGRKLSGGPGKRQTALDIKQPKQNHGGTRELQKEPLEAAAGKTGECRQREQRGQRAHGKCKHRQRPWSWRFLWQGRKAAAPA